MKIKLGTSFTVFLLFFGVALLAAFQTATGSKLLSDLELALFFSSR